MVWHIRSGNLTPTCITSYLFLCGVDLFHMYCLLCCVYSALVYVLCFLHCIASRALVYVLCFLRCIVSYALEHILCCLHAILSEFHLQYIYLGSQFVLYNNLLLLLIIIWYYKGRFQLTQCRNCLVLLFAWLDIVFYHKNYHSSIMFIQ